ncbi:MAG: DUF4845 domain-containing protein [Pseudomonadota bacterium]
MRRQRGLSLVGLILIGGLLVMVALVGMKVAPSVIEYFTILRNVKAMAASGELRGATVPDVRKAFDRRADVDDIKSISSKDLDITKEGNDVVISFAYEKRVHLFGPVSLAIDYQGSSAPGR